MFNGYSIWSDSGGAVPPRPRNARPKPKDRWGQTMSNYPHLFSPLAIRGLRFPNRIVRASLATELCEADGSVTEAFLTYYAKHAAGGAGLVMTEFASVDAVASRSFPRQLGCVRDLLIPGLTRLTSLFRATKSAVV